MLDADLRIRRMTPQAEEVLGIAPTDMGRPIRQLRLKVNVPNLEHMMLDVMQGLQPREMQLQVGRNRRYRLRITPYRTMDNRIEGVVLAFVDMLGPPSTMSQPAKTKGRKEGARRNRK
jgi:two-component system CheB/CheR fusion protein